MSGVDRREPEKVWERGQAAWPGVELSVDDFVAFVAERAQEGSTDVLYLDDLYLACACAEGDAAAIAAVEKRHVGELGAALATFEQSGTSADEVRQLLRVRLFVGEDGRRPRIADYGGLSGLGAWIKVIAVRIAISLIRKNRREVAVGDDLLADVPEQVSSPELALLKETYRSEFRAVFEASFRALSPRDRNLLRHQVLDHMSIDRIGGLYGVHRATAARWVARARDALVSGVRQELQARLRIGRDELDSILRLVQSQIDVSLRLFLTRT